MKAFVINLKNRPDRLKQFRLIGLPFEVEAHTVEKHENGSLGCIISHLECFKKFSDGVNIIFEDDCVQVSDINVMFNAFDELGDNWDVLYLGAMVHGEIKTNTKHTDILEGGWTTHAIAYNGRRVADYMLQFKPEDIRSQRRNIDTFMVYNVQRNPLFKCYITNPQIFMQELNYSDVINDIRNYEWKHGIRI